MQRPVYPQASQGPKGGKPMTKPAAAKKTTTATTTTKKPAVQDDVKQRPIIQEDDTDAGAFGQSLYVDNIEDKAQAMAHQNPWLVREKKSFLKGNIMPPNVNYKPVMNKANNQNTNQSKVLGPYPPEFRMMHKPPEGFVPQSSVDKPIAKDSTMTMPQRRNSRQLLPPIEEQSRVRGFESFNEMVDLNESLSLQKESLMPPQMPQKSKLDPINLNNSIAEPKPTTVNNQRQNFSMPQKASNAGAVNPPQQQNFSVPQKASNIGAINPQSQAGKSGWWRNSDNLQETFHSAGNSIFTEQEESEYEAKVDPTYIPSQEELNFAKENINHKVAQSSFQGKIFDNEDESLPPAPFQKSQVEPVEKKPARKSFAGGGGYAAPKEEFLPKRPEMVPQYSRSPKGDNIQRPRFDDGFDSEEEEVNDDFLKEYQEPKRRVDPKPLQGFKVPLIVDQNPKKVFEPQQKTYYHEDASLVSSNLLPKAVGSSYPKEVRKQNLLEPSYLPNFNWEPVQASAQQHSNLPNHLKIFSPSQGHYNEFEGPLTSEIEDLKPVQAYPEEFSGSRKIVIAFLLEGKDGKGRRAYTFELKRSLATVFDLKEIIMSYFGYDITQQKIYKGYLELGNEEVIENLSFTHKEEVLLFANIGFPYEMGEGMPKRFKEKSMNDIRGLNCSNLMQQEFYNMAFEENIVMPPFRDWSKEWQEIFNQAMQLKKVVEIEKSSVETREIAQLVELEKSLVSIVDHFRVTALKAVQLIEKKQVQPTYLDNMYGKGGLKYIIGGMVVRECKNWILLTKDVGEGNLCYKLAGNECKALEFMRDKIQGIETPLCCLINYSGTGYFVQSICPISLKSLVYGSNTEGIDMAGKEMALEAVRHISQLFNIKEHIVYDRVTRVGKYVCMAYDCELHEGDDGNFYFLNPIRMLTPDITNSENLYEINGRVFRPEFQAQYCSDELEEGFVLSTWRNPVPCESCDRFITDYEFYYYEKRSVNREKGLIAQIFYCPSCYLRLKPGHGFKVPTEKLIHRVVPFNERKVFWMNIRTGQTSLTKPGKKINLNPDANVMFPEFSEGEEKNYIQKENLGDQNQLLRASKYLRNEVIHRLVVEADNFDIILKNIREFCILLHKRGINLRYLGILATESKHNFVREMCIREIIARSIKALIREGLYFLKKQTGVEQEADTKKFIVYYLNEIFTMKDRDSSTNIWQLLTELIYNKFEVRLEKEILQNVHLPALIHRTTQIMNLQASKLKGYNLSDDNPFSISDFNIQQPYNMKMKTIYSLSVELLLTRAREKDQIGKRTKWFLIGGPERVEATELFRKASVICEYIYGNSAKESGEVFKEFAAHLESRHAEKGKVEYSQWNKCANIPEDELSLEARDYWHRAIKIFTEQYGEYDPIIAECMVSLAYLHKINTKTITLEAEYLEEKQNTLFDYLLSAIDIYDVALGVDHPETAGLCNKLALAYKEANIWEKAYSWIQRAFCSFANIFGSEDEILIPIYDQVKSIGLYFDPDITKVSIEEMCSYIENQVFNNS